LESEQVTLLFTLPSFEFTLLLVPSVEIGALSVCVILLLLGAGLISGSEIAIFSLTANDYDRFRLEKTRSARRILQLKERPRSLLATVLITKTFFNIAIVILSEYILRQTLTRGITEYWATSIIYFLGMENWAEVGVFARSINFLITILGVSFLLVLSGEVLPKVYAHHNNIRLAKVMSAPLVFLSRVLSPVSYILVYGTGIIENRLASKSAPLPLTSKEDIDQAIDLTVSHEKNAQQDVDLLKSIVKFGDVSVKQIMRSRVDVVAVDAQTKFTDLLKQIREAGYSRMPVFENDFDNVTGILYVKDLIGHLEETPTFKWQELIRPDVLFVPETKKISDMLKDFQHSRLHLAIVVDEYGGTSGIVTMEDIMEEVIGEIRDEFDDEPEVQYKKIDDSNYLFEGKTMLQDISKITGIPIETFEDVRGESGSIAGLILELIGYIPKPDRELTYKRYKLKVVSANERRIVQVLITLPKEF
jgi:gliding motility-associated protein GldE